MKKRRLSILLAVCLLVSLLPTAALAADPVSYWDWDTANQELAQTSYTGAYTELTNENPGDTNWSDGWYVVQGTVEIASRVTVTGDVHLILTDGCTLTVTGGIAVQDDDDDSTNGSANALTIYAQANGTGKLTVPQLDDGDHNAAIGGNSNGGSGGSITINGGIVEAAVGEWCNGAAIGGGGSEDGNGGSGGTITINGGTVTATVISRGAAIGGGFGNSNGGSGGSFTINGGTVTATSSGNGAAIGGGSGYNGGSGGTITINGGSVQAESDCGAGIGGSIGGYKGGSGGTITITGGSVNATSDYGAGIGGSSGSSKGGSGGTITITGGIVEATGKGGAGIGGGKGNGNDGGEITISGGTVTAISSGYGAGIGGGGSSSNGGSGGAITISGGIVEATGDGAGIGGGKSDGTGGSGGAITISGGTVTATSSGNSAGIGGGAGNFSGGDGGEISISGGTVTATSSGDGAGIGGGFGNNKSGGSGGTISITSGTVIATSSGNGAGIGGGAGDGKSGGSGGVIAIRGGDVTATSSGYGAGIGGGYCRGDVGSGGEITISGGTVQAESAGGSAGIGGGSDDNGTFQTQKENESNGSAVIFTNSIGDQSKQDSWHGILFVGAADGIIYGDSIAPADDFTIPTGKTLSIESGKALTIPAGVTLTIADGGTLTIENGGTLTNNGTIINLGGTINGTVAGNQPRKGFTAMYLDETGTEQTCGTAIVVESGDTTWGADGKTTWYVVPGTDPIAIDSRITVSGDVHLILANNCTLTVTGGIQVAQDNSLTIYAQSTEESTMGKLNATDTFNGAGIGGNYRCIGGTITINGGIVEATGGTDAAGIGGGSCGSGGYIAINGGTVTANGGWGAAGIGGGYNGRGSAGSTITISGGIVEATGGTDAAGIGGGSGGNGGNITISGGTVTANGGNYGGAGIGSGYNGYGGTFQTTDAGSAVIFASSIGDQSNKDNWSGVIFAGSEGKVYGSSIAPIEDFTIDSDKILLIPESAALTIAGITAVNSGSVYVDGALTGTVDGNVYYPLTVTGGTAGGDVSTYLERDYGKAAGTVTLTGTNIPTGKELDGWATSESTVTVENNAFTMPAKALTVTAQYRTVPYTITYELNGGTADNPATYTVESDAITLNNPTRTGCTFAGWSGTDLSGENNTSVTIPQGSTGHRTYTAHWTPDTYNVALVTNGGTINSGAVTGYTYGQRVTLPTDVTRAGYAFAGWYDNEACTGEPVTAISATDTGDKTFYAAWAAIYPPTIADTEEGGVTVSPSEPQAGDPVTITPKPGEGYEVDTVVVTDPGGNPLEVTDNGDGTYSFTQPEGAVTIRVTFRDATVVPFVDVPADTYYYHAVQWAVRHRITHGTSATTFSPDDPCTRAQTVTFLWRAAGRPAPTSSEMPFTDVVKGSYYEKAVLWAVENGITKGTSATTFSPDATCSRAQFATFLWRAQGKPAPGAANPFTDVAENAYYTNAVLWAAEHGITEGTTPTTFSPDEVCKRAQTVTFLYRCLSR